jgi:hypothetical protein
VPESVGASVALEVVASESRLAVEIGSDQNVLVYAHVRQRETF